MSLKSTFLAFKRSGTSCPNWGERGGGGNLDKIQKNSYFFFVKPSLSKKHLMPKSVVSLALKSV